MSVNLVQVSDLHLFTERNGQLADVTTWESFEAVLARVDAEHGDYDCLVITGDIAQDEAAATYAQLRECLGARLPRCRLIPGNHDDRGHLRATFPEQFGPEQGSLDFDLPLRDWRIIGLDTQLTGAVHGHLDPVQLAWLEARLAERAQPTALFLHHPPIPIGVEWLDRPAFDNAARLLALLAAAPHVQVICAGHVHQDFSGRIGTAAFYTTPSTCVQFASHGEDRYDPAAAAGYRHLRCTGEGVTTQVYRID